MFPNTQTVSFSNVSILFCPHVFSLCSRCLYPVASHVATLPCSSLSHFLFSLSGGKWILLLLPVSCMRSCQNIGNREDLWPEEDAGFSSYYITATSGAYIHYTKDPTRQVIMSRINPCQVLITLEWIVLSWIHFWSNLNPLCEYKLSQLMRNHFNITFILL